MSEICSENSETFDVWRTLATTGVKGYMNRVTYASQVMRPWGPLLPMHTPDAAQQLLSEMANWNLKKGQFLVCGQGGIAPYDPVNPYLGGKRMKKMGHFLIVNPFMHALESPVWS